MSRIIGIDFGSKKIGMAATDPLQIIVSPIDTFDANDFWPFLLEYVSKEDVTKIVVGEPLNEDGSPAQFHEQVLKFVRRLEKQFPNVDIALQDEYGTSLKAKEIILQSVPKKMKRRNKKLVDKISATLILQTYLKHI